MIVTLVKSVTSDIGAGSAAMFQPAKTRSWRRHRRQARLVRLVAA